MNKDAAPEPWQLVLPNEYNSAARSPRRLSEWRLRKSQELIEARVVAHAIPHRVELQVTIAETERHPCDFTQFRHRNVAVADNCFYQTDTHPVLRRDQSIGARRHELG